VTAVLELPPLKERALADSGVMAREILGSNFDKDDRTGKHITPGGILPHGPHQQMVDFLDSPSLNKHLEAPRGSYKTSLLHAYVIRRTVANRNLRVLYAMETGKVAVTNMDAIAKHFESERFMDVFGDLSTDQWSVKDGFTIAGRSVVQKEPTFSCAGVDTGVTGGHYDIIILDDVVTWDNVRNADAIQKTRDFYQMVLPLLDPGGTLIVVGTRYGDSDLYSYILEQLTEEYEILVLDAGVELMMEEGKRPWLEGEPRFKHLTKELLLSKLRHMEPIKFASQYLNRCIGSSVCPFARAHFKYLEWDDWMHDLVTYVITDTATVADESACQSVIGVVGIDSIQNAYLLDLRVGYWQSETTLRTMLSVYAKWQERTKLRGMLMEHITLNRMFRAQLDPLALKEQIRINYIPIMRGSGEPSKCQRIENLSSRFWDGRFFVVDTVPKYYETRGETKMLFDPAGYTDAAGVKQPDGELVKQFIRYPSYTHNDIADAIADIDAIDREGSRLCTGMSRRSFDHHRERDTIRYAGKVIPMLARPGSGQEFPNADFYSNLARQVPRAGRR
jgi:hypothetical protein